jgi:hypothetical protein
MSIQPSDDPGEETLAKLRSPYRGELRQLISPLGRLDNFATSPRNFASLDQGLTRLIDGNFANFAANFTTHTQTVSPIKFRHS